MEILNSYNKIKELINELVLQLKCREMFILMYVPTLLLYNNIIYLEIHKKFVNYFSILFKSHNRLKISKWAPFIIFTILYAALAFVTCYRRRRR